MIDSSFVEAIDKIAKEGTSLHSIFDQKVLVVGGVKTEYDNPQIHAPDLLRLTTLQGIVDFYNSLPGKNELTVHVASPTSVQVFLGGQGDWQQNLYFAEATPVLPKYGLNQWLDPEEFMIMIMSCFYRHGDGEQDAVREAASSMKAGIIAEAEDDGNGQTITVKAGVVRSGKLKITNPVFLAPYRTFVEVAQPLSPFIFRTKQNKIGDNLFAQATLIDADGGKWRIEAIASIAAWLREKLGAEATILA